MRDVNAASLSRQGSGLLMRLMALSVLVVVAAAATVSAHAQDRGGPGAEGAPGMMMFGGSPEHSRRAVDHLLDGLNASDAQRTQVKQIVMSAAADLKAQRDAGRGLRENALQAFTAPIVDAASAEAVRQQMSAQHDQASKRMLQAMLDVANVLTPEQRAKIGERMKERQAVMNDRRHRMQAERSKPGPRQAPAK